MKFAYIVLVSSILFGIINASFEVIIEEDLENKIIHHTHNKLLANIISSSLAGATAIIVYSYFEIYLNNKHKKIPLYDSIGVLIGGLCVYSVYFGFNFILFQPENRLIIRNKCSCP